MNADRDRSEPRNVCGHVLPPLTIAGEPVTPSHFCDRREGHESAHTDGSSWWTVDPEMWAESDAQRPSPGLTAPDATTDAPDALGGAEGRDWHSLYMKAATERKAAWDRADDLEAALAVERARVARVEALVEGWFKDSSLFDCSRRDTCCRDARDDERVEVVEALRAALAEPEATFRQETK